MNRDRTPRPVRRLAAAVVLTLLFLAFHLPYLPASLEDLDSINFALGLRLFDVAGHQPHPPGYPLFIGLGKVARAVTASEAHALGALSVVAGSLSAIALLAFFGTLVRGSTRDGHDSTPRARSSPVHPRDWEALAATVLCLTAPMYWFTAVRPLSDMAGLAVSLGVMAIAAGDPGGRRIVAAAGLAALAAGVRSQVVWLTFPFITFALARHMRRRRRFEPRLALATLAAYAGGLLVWAVPLVALSGGPAAYWNAVFYQGSQDLSGVAMLWTTPTVRQLAIALNATWAAPWGTPLAAGVVLLLGASGVLRAALRDRSSLTALAVAFTPYLVFDLLFQESVTTRYALPLVVPTAYFAAQGAAALGPRLGLVIVGLVSGWNLYAGSTSVAAYASRPAPAFRMLADMADAARRARPADSITLAMDRRADFDLRRPIRWIGDRVAGVGTRLPAPPRREWLELVKYWNDPATPPNQPVWFVVDPSRDYMAMIQHGAPATYRWSVRHPLLLGGTRPDELDWYTLAEPEWYLGPGWSLTPEVNGLAKLDGDGLDRGAIRAWLSRSVFHNGALVIAGRNLTSPPANVRLELAVDETPLVEMTATPGTFVELVPLPGDSAIRFSPSGYAGLTVRAAPAAHVEIEQFDASATRPLSAFGRGWYEYEYDPARRLRWRWLSAKGELVLHAPRGAVLHLEGESPLTNFPRASHLVVRLGNHVIADAMLSSNFSLSLPISADLVTREGNLLTLETDQTFVPSERTGRTRDARRLGLRVVTWELRTAPPQP